MPLCFIVTSCHFNPRTHEECDRRFNPEIILIENFNPRTHEECD